jgi:dGTPase
MPHDYYFGCGPNILVRLMDPMKAWESRRSGDEQRRSEDDRNAFDRDRARIIHSASFRRLQAKTQVLGIGEGDFHRTRLTHSMEVAQISGGIVQRLRALQTRSDVKVGLPIEWMPELGLTEAVAFSHDVGHPPFGHGGEIALNYMMRNSGGFEGNGQSLRILSVLESHTAGYGLDPTRRTLLGILKYPSVYDTVVRTDKPDDPAELTLLQPKDWKPPKCFLNSESAVVEWVLAPFRQSDRERFTSIDAPRPDKHGKSKFKSLDTSIMELADDISYGVHDLEDGVALHLITREHWLKMSESLDETWSRKYQLESTTQIADELFDDSGSVRKRIIGALVNAFISSTYIDRDSEFDHPLLAYNAKIAEPARIFLDALKDLTSKHIVKLQAVQTLEYKGRYVVMSLFEALSSDPVRLLKPAAALEYQRAATAGAKNRVISDYVAGMTDNYAGRIYSRLFLPGAGNVFERL